MRELSRRHLRSVHWRREWCAQALRCQACGVPIILVWKYPERKRVPVHADTWDGNIYYVRGVHKTHYQSCIKFLEIFRRNNARHEDEDGDFYVEDIT